MTFKFPAANKLLVLLAAVARCLRSASTRHPRPTRQTNAEQHHAIDNARPCTAYGPTGPNRVPISQGPRTRVYVTKRSWLTPASRCCRATANSPTTRSRRRIGYPSFARENNNRPLDRQPLNSPS